MAVKGKTALRLSGSGGEASVVRALQVIAYCDRTQLTVVTGQPYGTVSRMVSMLHNEGYLEEVLAANGKQGKRSYSPGALRRNPDLKGCNLNYGNGKARVIRSAVYRKSGTWSEFMTRWRAARVAWHKRSALKAREAGAQ